MRGSPPAGRRAASQSSRSRQHSSSARPWPWSAGSDNVTSPRILIWRNFWTAECRLSSVGAEAPHLFETSTMDKSTSIRPDWKSDGDFAVGKGATVQQFVARVDGEMLEIQVAPW